MLAYGYNKHTVSKNYGGISLQPSNTQNIDNSFESFGTLIQIMRNDEDINKKVMAVLSLDPYKRRAILNNWLEQLCRENAPQQLTKTLSYLFDDAIAQKVLGLIKGIKE